MPISYMSIVAKNLKYYLNRVKKERKAIGQFNFSTLEQLKGILAAAEKLKSPVILGVSQGEVDYLGAKSGPVFLNLDHGKDLNLIKKAINYGFSAVHFDGSALSLDKNIKYAKKIVEYAHKRNVLVEGEINAIKKDNLTSLEQAEYFVKATKVDSLAIAIGNRHGFYRNVKLNFKRLKEIEKKLRVFLVLHGGSGIPEAQIKKAINLGIVKINVNTELRLVWKKSLKILLSGKEIKPYRILTKVQKDIQKKVEEKIKLFGSRNKS